MWQQYFLWMGNMLKGDFGQSFQWKQPVKALIASRMPMTIALSVIALVFAYALAKYSIGIYSAGTSIRLVIIWLLFWDLSDWLHPAFS